MFREYFWEKISTINEGRGLPESWPVNVEYLTKIFGGQIGQSGCPEQVALNQMVCDYIKEQARNINEDNCVQVYVQCEDALQYLRTQKSKYIPEEVREAETLFEDLKGIISQNPLWVERFPRDLRGQFYQRIALNKGAEVSSSLNSPYGEITVGIKRNAGSFRWERFCVVSGKEHISPVWANLYALSPKKFKLSVKTLYNEDTGIFWGWK